MKFFALACDCPHKDQTSEPLIAYDDEGEFVPIYRTKELAQIAFLELQENEEHGHKLAIKEFEMKAV